MSSSFPPTVILFGAHRWHHERYVDDALQAGMCVILAASAGDKEGISQTLAERVHHTIRMPPEDEPQLLLNLVQQLNEKHGPDWRVLSFDDYVGEDAARLSEVANRPFLSRTAEEETRCKHLMRKRWNRFCERHPEMRLRQVPYSFRTFSDFSDARSVSEIDESPEFSISNGPFIIKPDELAASLEVRRVESRDLLDSAIAGVVNSLRDNWYAEGGVHGVRVRPRIQVEIEIPRSRNLRGHPHAEFSVEFLSEGGRHHLLGITQKWISSSFAEVGHLFPSASFPPLLLADLKNAVRRLLDEMDVSFCISHWEFIVTPDERLALVESHVRPGGDKIMELIEYATGEYEAGEHPVRALLECLRGQEVDAMRFQPMRMAAICYLAPARQVGRIADIHIDSRIGSFCREWFIDKQSIAADKDWFGPSAWGNRYVWVITTGKDTDEILALCYKAANWITFVGETGETRLTVPW